MKLAEDSRTATAVLACAPWESFGTTEFFVPFELVFFVGLLVLLYRVNRRMETMIKGGIKERVQ